MMFPPLWVVSYISHYLFDRWDSHWLLRIRNSKLSSIDLGNNLVRDDDCHAELPSVKPELTYSPHPPSASVS